MMKTARTEQLDALSFSSRTLADGTYAPNDARDLMQALLSSAIEFHKLLNLRCQVHTESPFPDSCERAKDLTTSRDDLERLFSLLEAGAAEVRMRAEIEFEVVERPYSV